MLKQTAMLLLVAATIAPAFGQETKTFTYKKTKQGDLEVVVHYPPGWKETDKRPGIVFFFGGGWASGKIEQFEPQAKHLAGRGMVAARADYRVKSRHNVTPKECVEDAKSAVRWMRQNAAKLGVAPNRIVAAGGSAGGHIAACTALTPGLDAEGEDAKISSIPNALVLFNPVLRFSGIPELMGRIDKDEALGKAISPTLHLKKDSPPTLILFGTADRLAAMGDEFMKKSKELGHRAELFTAEGQPHGFFNRSPWLEKTTQRMDEFLVAIGYLEGKATPTATGTKTFMKGWRLHIWQQGDGTYYSLMPGTNWVQSEEDVVKAAVKGIDSIKPQLDELKQGQEVFLCGKSFSSQPPKDQAAEVMEYGKKIGVKVQEQTK
jgi:acetyl esterase/lipase